MKKIPAIDLRDCSDCETCVVLCPEVFIRNHETGRIEIKDLEEYPEEAIFEVVSYCPRNCISLSEEA
jgi:ferredoxin